MYVLLISFGHFRHASREHKGVFDDKPGVIVAAFKVDKEAVNGDGEGVAVTLYHEVAVGFVARLSQIIFAFAIALGHIDGALHAPFAAFNGHRRKILKLYVRLEGYNHKGELRWHVALARSNSAIIVEREEFQFAVVQTVSVIATAVFLACPIGIAE